MAPQLPGRLGNPELQLGTDQRADPRMVAALAPLGLDGPAPASPVTADSSIDDILSHCKEAEAGFQALGGVLAAVAPPIEGVSSRTEVITGVNGNDINLYIHTPDDLDGPAPCIVHTHGGGMVILTAADEGYVRWRDELASMGLIVVGVEFRNGGGILGPHPFPAGLNDCVSATRWVVDNAASLGASKVVISGESGGGNLSVATAMKAKADGWGEYISGVYSLCPYVSGQYVDPPDELPSLTENDGYLLDVENMGALALAYDPDGENATNPLAWPYHASAEDLAGLPPVAVVVNELDPLRDEGLALYRKLMAAGVDTSCRTVNGTCHAGDVLFRDAMPNVYLNTVGDIALFANLV